MTTNRFDDVQPPSHSTDKPAPGPLKSLLEKALDEVARGNPEEGERLLELALLKDADTGKTISTLIEALERAAFLLRRVHEGDHKALEKAMECAEAVGAVIARATGGST